MSKLFKSKFLLGVMVVAVMLAGFVAVSAPKTADAATCTITTTLRVGSRGAEVKCLQAALDNGLVGDGVFGPKTKAKVVAWQAAHGLVADGVFGAKSRAAWTGSMSMTLPAGCTSTSGYSTTTGMPCNSGSTGMTLPAGCTSTSGYSSTTGQSCSGGSTPVVSGPISAMVSSDTPASGYIIDNQAQADLAHFTFTGTGVVSSITLHRTGISDQNTLTNVYLYDGVNRLTDGYSFNTASDIVMNNLGLVVSGSRTIQVKGDASSTASNNSTIRVSMTSFMPAGGSATATNLMGNEMLLASGASLATVTLNAANTVTGTPTVDTGTMSYTVWSQAVQVNTRTVQLKGANFRMTGSAPADAFANIRLYVDGADTGKVATVTTVNGSNYAVFDLMSSPVNLTTGSHTLDLRVDVVRGASYNVTTSIQSAADLTIFDPQVGVNIAASASSPGTLPSSGASVTINAGTGTVVIDPAFQSMSNVTGGASNAVIAKFKVTGYSEDVKVTSLSVTPVLVNACTSGTTYGSSPCNDNAGADATQFATGNGLQNVTLYFNGSQVGSQTSSWNSGAITFTLGSQMIVPAGQVSTLEVHADLRSTGALSGTPVGVNYTAGTVSANLTAVTSNAQGQTSHSNVTLPTASITGKTLSIQTGLLAVSKNTGFASQSVTPNTAGVKIGSYVLQNQSTSESVRVTSLALALTRANGSTALDATTSAGVYPALTNFSGLRTSETSGSGATPRQPAASNTFSVDFTIAAGATKTIDVYADTSTLSGGEQFSSNLVVTAIGTSSNVSVSQNGNGTAVTGQVITLATGTLGTPSLLTANSTAQQFVPAGNGGATDATKATFKFTSSGGSSTISELKFTVNSQDLSTTTADTDIQSTGAQTVTVGSRTGILVGDVVQLVGATTTGLGVVTATGSGAGDLTIAVTVAATGAPSAVRLVPSTVTSVRVGSVTAPVVSGIAYLTGLNLQVPNGGSGLTQDVFVSYSPVGTNGVQTGSTSRLALEYIKSSGGGSTSSICTATITGGCDSATLTAVTAPTMKLVGSRPTATLTSSTSTLTTGLIDVGSVTITANSKGDITLNTLPVSVTLTNATLANANPGYNADGIRVYDKDNNLVTTTNTAFSATTAGGTSTITFTGGYQISAGTSQTFHIYLQFATVTNASGAHTSSATLGLGTADVFSWTDTGGNASATTGTDVAADPAYTTSNRYLYSTTAPGFFYGYPTNTVSVSS